MFDTVETLCHKKKAVSMNVDKNIVICGDFENPEYVD